MLTIKYTDQDGYERLTQGEDIRVKKNGQHAESITWKGVDSKDRKDFAPCCINHATTVYVMNDGGATVGKYIVIPRQKEKAVLAA